MATFVSLPLELIQSIAAWCPAPDILSLCQTCRPFRVACNESAVFQHSFEAHLPEPISPVFTDKNALVHFMKAYVDGSRRPCQHKDGPQATWRCLAVAAARIPQITIDLERLVMSVKLHATLESQHLGQDTKESLQGLIGLLSTLPIWGYSAICNSTIAATLDSLCPIFFSKTRPLQHLRIDRSLCDKHPLRFAFRLALSGLQPDDWQHSNLASTETGNPRIPLGPGTDALRAIVKSVFEIGRSGPGYNAFENSYIGKHTHALLLSVLITRNLQYVAKKEERALLPWVLGLGSASRGRQVQIRVPSPSKIDFFGSWYFENQHGGNDKDHLRVRDGPLRPQFPLLTPNLTGFRGNMNDRGRYFYPFAGDEWWSWYTSRVRDLANHLDEGEWYGCYTYGLSLGDRVDDPMTGICFRKVETVGDAITIEASNCSDGIGTFNLTGVVSGSDSACTVRFTKQYATHTFTWDGQITPLGILGAYYSPMGFPRTTPHGYFWLWKKEWMDDMIA